MKTVSSFNSHLWKVCHMPCAVAQQQLRIGAPDFEEQEDGGGGRREKARGRRGRERGRGRRERRRRRRGILIAPAVFPVIALAHLHFLTRILSSPLEWSLRPTQQRRFKIKLWRCAACSFCLRSWIPSWEGKKKCYCHNECRDTKMCRFCRICLYKEALTLAVL